MSESPSDLIPPERALRAVDLTSDGFEDLEGVDDSIDFLTSSPGRKIEEKALNRSVNTETRESTLSEAADSAGTVDQGPPTGFETMEYSGVIEQEKVDCEACGGSGRTCLRCDGDTTISCSACTGGTKTYSCGCTGSEINYGYESKVTAGRGEILDICENCAGDGRISSDYTCESCNGKGGFANTCPNCGGDGVSNREQCTQCDAVGTVRCPECNGTGDVDDCPKCDAIGEIIREEHREVKYRPYEKTLIDGSDMLKEHIDQISFREKDRSLAESECESFLNHITTGSNIVRAQRVEYEPVAYEAELYNAEVDIMIESIDDESLNMLVSDDGLVDWESSPADKRGDERFNDSNRGSAGNTDMGEQKSSFFKTNIKKLPQAMGGLLIGVVTGEILATDILLLAPDALLAWIIALGTGVGFAGLSIVQSINMKDILLAVGGFVIGVVIGRILATDILLLAPDGQLGWIIALITGVGPTVFIITQS